MNDLYRDSLRARLRQGDPHRGESMPALDAARVKARVRAATTGATARPTWIPAAAVAATVTVVALGVWTGSRPGTRAPASATAAGGNGSAAAPAEPAEPVAPVAAPQSQLAPGLGQRQPAVVHAAPALPEPAPAATLLALPEAATAAQGAPPTEAQRAEVRRVRFTAPRGTRIVWTLDPDFEPGTARDGAPSAPHQQGANERW